MKQMWDQKDLVKLIKEYSEGGGGSTYTAGTGISILDYVISVDTTVIPSLDDLQNNQAVWETIKAGSAKNLRGSGGGRVPYNSSFNTTSFVAPASNDGDIFMWDATNNKPYWNAQEALLKVGGVTISTDEPTADNETGGFIFVVLSSAPATYYNGYIYLIEETV